MQKLYSHRLDTSKIRSTSDTKRNNIKHLRSGPFKHLASAGASGRTKRLVSGFFTAYETTANY